MLDHEGVDVKDENAAQRGRIRQSILQLWTLGYLRRGWQLRLGHRPRLNPHHRPQRPPHEARLRRARAAVEPLSLSFRESWLRPVLPTSSDFQRPV